MFYFYKSGCGFGVSLHQYKSYDKFIMFIEN